MIIRYNKSKTNKKYVVTSDSSGSLTITDKMSFQLPNYEKTKVFLEQDVNESSSDL